MGILANTVSFCQYRIGGDPPQGSPLEWAGGQLARQGFQSIDHSAEEESAGWVCLDDQDEATFAVPGAFYRDRYVTFSLRRDRRRVPAALVRRGMEQESARFLTEHPGLKRVPKQKREELREAVVGQLLAKTLPVPAVFDAVWDLETGLLTLATLNAQGRELFENLFKTTFEGLRPVALHPLSRAEQLLDEGGRRALEGANQAASDNVVDLIQANRWLGTDLLLWLLFRSMTGEADFTVDQPGPALSGEGFAAYLNDKLVLVGGGETGMQKISVAGPQDSFDEVRAALLAGKEITDATLYFEKGEEQWKMTLKGEVFDFSSFKCPPVKLEKDDLTDEAREREALFFERMYLVETGLQLFNSLFAAFLRERLAPGWAEERGRIQTWLEQE